MEEQFASGDSAQNLLGGNAREMRDQAEVIREFNNPKTYKEKVDYMQAEMKKKRALSQIALESEEKKEL